MPPGPERGAIIYDMWKVMDGGNYWHKELSRRDGNGISDLVTWMFVSIPQRSPHGSFSLVIHYGIFVNLSLARFAVN